MGPQNLRRWLNISVILNFAAIERESPAPEETKNENEYTKKRHLNVVFIGHAGKLISSKSTDAGKTTTGGKILMLSGQVEDRTIQKQENGADDRNREIWYMSYVMNTSEEERLEGHKSYVPNMISEASQADIGVLVISSRKGEFETGFKKGGQTREHVQLANNLGVSKMLVVVNKMDDRTVNWSFERYSEIESKMTPFLNNSGYNVKKVFLPISGLVGTNIKTRVNKNVCPWWNGACLLEALDVVEVPTRDPEGPFRMPIIDKFQDMGTVVVGKVESGHVREGDGLIIMPNKAHVKVVAMFCDGDKVTCAGPGENLRIQLSLIVEEKLSGFVLYSAATPIPAVSEFVAQLQIVELLDNAIFAAGYKAMLHVHSAVQECEIVELMHQIDPKARKPIKKKVLFVKNGAYVRCRIEVNEVMCREIYCTAWTIYSPY